MIKFYKYHFIRRLWFLPAIVVFTYAVLSSFLETRKLMPFIAGMEGMLMLPAFFMSVFTLTNRVEIEFCKCYGRGVAGLCIAQIGPYVLFTLLAMAGAVLLFPLDIVGVTALGRLQIFLAGSINLLAVVSVAVFIRLLIRNVFGAIGFELIFYYLLRAIDDKDASVISYITPNGLSHQMLHRLPIDTFYVNRLLFLGAAVIFAVGAYLLMRSPNYTEVE